MDPIRVAASLPPISSPANVTPVRPVAELTESEATPPRILDPAVLLGLRPEAAEAKPPEPEQRAYVRDAESESLVFRVTDPATGDVVMQIPNEVIIKARVYARETTAFAGERVAKTA